MCMRPFSQNNTDTERFPSSPWQGNAHTHSHSCTLTSTRTKHNSKQTHTHTHTICSVDASSRSWTRLFFSMVAFTLNLNCLSKTGKKRSITLYSLTLCVALSFILKQRQSLVLPSPPSHISIPGCCTLMKTF